MPKYEYNKKHSLWTPEFLTPEMLMEFEKEEGNHKNQFSDIGTLRWLSLSKPL